MKELSFYVLFDRLDLNTHFQTGQPSEKVSEHLFFHQFVIFSTKMIKNHKMTHIFKNNDSMKPIFVMDHEYQLLIKCNEKEFI